MNKALPVFDLTTVDSNAFCLMAGWQRAARKAGWSKSDIDLVLNKCTSGDYYNLIATLSKNCTNSMEA